MINWEKVKFTDLGEIILQFNPLMVCDKEEFIKRVKNREGQVGFWKDKLNEFEQQGILK